ncbi:MAG: hypothetical protein ACI8RP_001769 [Urechidicola sp.]|jgi:hypothetical protein
MVHRINKFQKMKIKNGLLFLFATLVTTISFSQNVNNKILDLERYLGMLQVHNDSLIISVALNTLRDSLEVIEQFRFKNEMVEKKTFQLSIKDINSYRLKDDFITIGCEKNTVKYCFYDYNILAKEEDVSEVTFYTNRTPKYLSSIDNAFKSIIKQNQKVTFETKTWQETLTYIQQHKDALIDFHYYTPEAMQTVVLKDGLLIVKVTDDKMKYIHEAHLKNLEQVRDYKGEGLLLTFGWKNVGFTAYDRSINTMTEESKSMHFGVRIDNVDIKKRLHNAFKRLVVLNKKQ